MNSKIKNKLIENGYENLINFLSNDLMGSELNSLLLEIFNRRSKHISLSQVLSDYTENRFVQPLNIDPIEYLERQIQILKLIKEQGFEVMGFSPLVPFGATAVHGTVNQNNIVSAIRRTEVVSDITNVLALETSKRLLEDPKLDKIDLGAAHRFVRAQSLDKPDHTAHFGIVGMTSSWKDEGNFVREHRSIAKHIKAYIRIFKEVYGLKITDLKLKLNVLSNVDDVGFKNFIVKVENCIETLQSETIYQASDTNVYYHYLRFGIFLKEEDQLIVDGGLVNWVSNFTQNRKRKLLISGIGTELLYKILKKRKIK